MAKALINQTENMNVAVNAIANMDFANLVLLNSQLAEHMFNVVQQLQIKKAKEDEKSIQPELPLA